jgi:hypothetical protein
LLGVGCEEVDMNTERRSYKLSLRRETLMRLSGAGVGNRALSKITCSLCWREAFTCVPDCHPTSKKGCFDDLTRLDKLPKLDRSNDCPEEWARSNECPDELEEHWQER